LCYYFLINLENKHLATKMISNYLFLNDNLNQTDARLAWTTARAHEHQLEVGGENSLRHTERLIFESGRLPEALQVDDLRDDADRPAKQLVLNQYQKDAKRKRSLFLMVQLGPIEDQKQVLVANDARQGRRWLFLQAPVKTEQILDALKVIAEDRDVIFIPSGTITSQFLSLVHANQSELFEVKAQKIRLGISCYQENTPILIQREPTTPMHMQNDQPSQALTHLDRLEAESMHIIREVMAHFENPVMLYSIGKDSSVMLHLAKKAFYPSPPPFPLMHVDTRWKFQEMYRFREEMAASSNMELICFVNPEGVKKNINPFDHGSALHTDIMKTQGLKMALDQFQFDAAFGGARRDEEKSRAKERVFSFRTDTHRWDPKNQRPELWNLYNGSKNKGESVRIFPLSNWTELDVWQYIYRENIAIVPLYYAAERPVVNRDGMLILVDDDRMRLLPNEQIELRRVRFRTLGCYPLTGAVDSTADDLSSIVLELLQSRTSERQGRAIDSDSSGSMEKKKQEGYF